MMGKRAQVSMEYLAIIMFFLLVSVPIFTYFYISGPEKEYAASITQAEKVANEIIDNSRLINSQGYGTKITRTIVIPKYVETINFTGNYVVITLNNNDKISQVMRKGSVKFNNTVIDVYGGISYTLKYENTVDGVQVSAPVYEVEVDE